MKNFDAPAICVGRERASAPPPWRLFLHRAPRTPRVPSGREQRRLWFVFRDSCCLWTSVMCVVYNMHTPVQVQVGAGLSGGASQHWLFCLWACAATSHELAFTFTPGTLDLRRAGAAAGAGGKAESPLGLAGADARLVFVVFVVWCASWSKSDIRCNHATIE